MPIDEPAAAEPSLMEFFVQKRPQLLAVAIRILRCPHLAEDVVQDAAIKASQMEVCRNKIASPEKFARRMVRNLAIDHIRRRTFETRFFVAEAAGAEIEAPCGNPCLHLEICDTLRSVLAALDELPPRTKRVFELNRLHGIAQKDIAREMNVSTTLVNLMVQRAHAHCYARLRSLEDGPVQPLPLRRIPRRVEKSSSGA
jgi:RNA polymerase sigma-70 factor (ECF subfamily)